MPVRLKCSCGKVLSLRDELAGKAVKCPSCEKTLRVPAKRPAAASPGAAAPKGALDDLFNEEGFDRKVDAACPACGAEMKADAILCTRCGYNKQTGETLEAHQTEGVDIDMGTMQLNRAAESMRRDAELQQKMHSKAGMPWWMLLVVLFVIASGSTLLVIVINARNQTEGEALNFDAQKTFYGLVAGLFLTLGGGGLLNVMFRYYKKQKQGNIKTLILSVISLGIGGYLATLAR